MKTEIINSLLKLYLNLILIISGVLSNSNDADQIVFNDQPYVQSNYPQTTQLNSQHTSAEFFKIFHIPYIGKLNLIDERVKQVKSDVKKVDTKLESLKKNYESLLTTTNLIYNRLLDYENKLEEILQNTKPKKLNSSGNQNLNFQYHNRFGQTNQVDQPNHRKIIANQRILVGRSISNENDYNQDFINEFIQNVFNWQNKTDLKLTKIMNVITEIYREDKQLGLDLSKLNERQTNEDRTGLVERMQKEFKEQFSINKAELKSYIGNVNENCLRTKTQNENLTFLLLGLKDDLSNPLKLSATKFNQENSVLPPDDENEKHPIVDANLITKNELFCKATNNLINTTIEQFRTDLNNVKQQILNKIDRENTRINERIYTLNNNYQHLNNLRNCNLSMRSLGQSNNELLNNNNSPNNLQDNSSNEIDSSKLHKTTNTMSTSTFIPPFYQVPRKREEDSRTRQSNSRTKLIDPIKYGSIKKKSCYSPNIMKPTSCEDLYLDRVNCDGIYVILIKDEAIRVYCEIDDTSGSTIIMRRGAFNNYTLTNFNQNWDKYKKGFGNIDADFWLGLDKIYELTKNKNQMLEINLESFDGKQLTLAFNQFYIDEESNNYKLTIGEPISNQNYANQFINHNGAYFATADRNDRRNCARKFDSGNYEIDN